MWFRQHSRAKWHHSTSDIPDGGVHIGNGASQNWWYSDHCGNYAYAGPRGDMCETLYDEMMPEETPLGHHMCRRCRRAMGRADGALAVWQYQERMREINESIPDAEGKR